MPSSAETAPHALELAGVCKNFGPVAALSDIAFTLNKGEFLTMLGPSGSGKTTTLRIIAGFMEPDSGDVRMHGESVAHAPPNKRNIGMVFQDYALFPHMSVAENVAFPLLARGCDRRTAAKKVEAMLEVVGLAGFGPRSIRQMSGGQSQRVALARALVFGPELVLLDEPMAALDKKLRGSMQTEILRIVKQLGATVISVTHDQEEALVMSDRIALFESGRLVQIGTPQELYERPSTSFVADFIGEANILSGTVGAGGTLIGAGWRCTAPAQRLGPPGQAVRVAIRPEKIHLDASGTVEAVVRQSVYLGVEYRLLLTLPDGAALQVRSRDMRQIQDLRPGASVRLAWAPEDVIVLQGA